MSQDLTCLTLEQARAQDKLPFVKLVGEDGNAFAIMGRVMGALRKEGLGHLATEFQQKATSGDYNNLLAQAMIYTSQDDEDEEDQ